MVFKKIEVFGFKSFADKLEVDFSSGITAIVGPNGCGKSNISDAIRWVLGEQSSKALRGTNMQDVIFKGTERRGSLSYCEVSLYFDNSSRVFPVDYSEVVLSRKLYRSGESEYFINKNVARLKDIRDLLHDSGIDRDGFTIISQGQVAEIINSKAENRRSIFEEAAGISKFKNRKIDAERKLEKTQSELERAQDVISEIERSLGPLIKQAETAEIYLALKEQLKNLEINAYIYQYDSASERKNELSRALEVVTSELEGFKRDLEHIASRSNHSMEETVQIDKVAEEMREKILSLSLELERASGAKRLVQEKLSLLTDQDADVKAEIEELERALHLGKDKRLEHEERLSQLKQKDIQVDEQLKISDAEFGNKLKALNELERENYESQTEVMAKLQTANENTSALAFLRAQRENLLSKLDEYGSELEKTIHESEELACQIATKSEQVDEYKSRLDAKIADVDKAVKKQARIATSITDLENILKVATLDRAQAHARQKTIKHLVDSGEGYKFSVKKLLEIKEQSDTVSKQIVGVVAKEITVPDYLESAIEVALGATAQNIITRSEDDAKNLVELLRAKNYGRATFLPLSSLKTRDVLASEREQVASYSSEQILGFASDLVTYDAKIAPVIKSILGRVVVARDLGFAVQFARDTNNGFKIVTLDGDVIEMRGSITGGSKNALANNLWHTNTLKNIEAELVQIEEKIASVTRELDAVILENKTLCEIIERDKVEIEELKLLTAQGEQLLAILKDEQNVKSFEIKDYQTKEIDTNKMLDGIILKIESYDDEPLDTKNAGEDFSKQRDEYRSLKEQVDIAHAEFTELKISSASIKNEIVGLQSAISALVNSNLITEKNLADKRATLAAINKNINMARETSATQTDERIYKTTVENLDRAKEELATIESRKEHIRARISQLEDARAEVGAAITSAQERFYKTEAALAKVDTDITTMQERIYEEYGLNYSSCYMFRDEGFVLETGLKKISELKKQISKLGNINLDAIEDSKSSKERYDSYREQVADLTSAKEDLEKVIRDLSQEMESKFKTDFNKINHNFQVVFKELFGGGNAKLVLTEPNDYLNSGIDIVAEPPGKKLQNITLLSGGEKALTAIAILFAILKLRPMPFCLLDEIEAALDDANVGRFASYLKKFSDSTQFIVITHRKPTMELADTLYGVTMAERGVSKMVSVKLSNWESETA